MVYKFLITLIMGSSIFAAACCGGGGSSSSVITSDNRAKLEVNYSNKAFVYDVSANGEISKRDSSLEEVQEKIITSFAYAFDNYLQLSTSLSTNKTTKRTNSIETSSSDLSDIVIGGAYEFLPETYYSFWKPRGFLFVNHSIPLGNGRYNSEEISGVDISSTGLHKTTLGSLFFKILGNFDLRVSGEISKYYPKSFEFKVSKENSYNYSMGLGYSPRYLSKTRLGASVTSYVDGRFKLGEESKNQKYTAMTMNASYMVDDTNSLILSYEDETLLGDPENTGLGRKISVGYTHFWML